MLLVVDFNVVFSALVNKGISFKVFKANASSKILEFISPEFFLSEFNSKSEKLLSVTALSSEDLGFIKPLILEQIKFIPYREFKDNLSEAESVNFDDSPYIALALKRKCPIFSGDVRLKKQAIVPVLSPGELLKYFPEE